jgi:hypothetical protein
MVKGTKTFSISETLAKEAKLQYLQATSLH